VNRSVAALSLMLAACGSTGDHIVTFRAAAAGPADINGPAEFTNDRGFHVVLNGAKLNVGALYLNQTVPILGANPTNCVLPGTYVGQVTSGAEVDLLSSTLQYFPSRGEGTTLPSLTGEVWYVRQAPAGDGSAADVDVNDTGVVAQVLTLGGIADNGSRTFPFTANVTIGENRTLPSSNPAEPGRNPICKQRIVSAIPASITLAQGGTLTLRVDPRTLLSGIDFSTLAGDPGDPSAYVFADSPGANQASTALYQTIEEADPYSLGWVP
jgi:hypothetical protein